MSALAIDIDWFVDTARERLRRAEYMAYLRSPEAARLIKTLNDVYSCSEYEADRLRRLQRGIVEALDVTSIGGHNVTVRSFVRLEDCYADDEASEP